MSATNQPPREDLEMLEIVKEFAKMNMDQPGGLVPMAIFAGCKIGLPGVPFQAVRLTGLGGSPADTAKAMTLVTVLGAAFEAKIVVIVFESWSLAADAEGAEDLIRKGLPLHKHPQAQECVYLVAESEAGRTNLKIAIKRKADGSAELEDDEDPIFESRMAFDTSTIAQDEMGLSIAGIISNFFIPSAVRSSPLMQQYLEGANDLLGDPIGAIKAGMAEANASRTLH